MSEEREQALDELALVYMRAAFRAWLEEREQVHRSADLNQEPLNQEPGGVGGP